MTERTHTIRRTRQAFVLAGVVALLGMPFSYATLQPQRADAQVLAVVEVGANLVANATLANKEMTLDGIAHTIAQAALSQMTASVVRWINSGFNGSPTFITDLGQYLKDVSDQVADDFIYGSSLNGACDAFELDVRATLEIIYHQGFEDQITCTLPSSLASGGDVGSAMGGWDDWARMTTQLQNNQYGALYLANNELSAQQAAAEQNAREEADWGRGYLALKSCVGVGDAKTCTTVTPGTVIADQLAKALNLGQDSLVNADEITDVVNALLAQLGQQAITGVNGLLGLGQASASSGSGSSYLDQLQSGQGGSIGYSGGGAAANPATTIQNALTLEQNVADAYGKIVNRVNTAENSIPSDCDAELSSTLASSRSDAQDGLLATAVNVAALQDILNRYNAAKTNPARTKVYNEYLDLVSGNSLHTQGDLSNLQSEYSEVDAEASDFEDSVDDQC
jgi:hypothetical protein